MYRWIGIVGLAWLLAACAAQPQLPLHVTLQPATGSLSDSEWASVRAVLDQRLNTRGVAHALEQASDQALVVKLPADFALATEQSLLTKAGVFEIIDPQGQVLPNDVYVCTSEHPTPPQGTSAWLDCSVVYQTIVGAEGLDRAATQAVTDTRAMPALELAIAPDAQAALYRFSSANIGRPATMLLDGTVVVSPVINGALRDALVLTEPSMAPSTSALDQQILLALLQHPALPQPLVVADTALEE